VIGIAEYLIGSVLELPLAAPCERWTPLDAGGVRSGFVTFSA
jgi:hypothetical protein